jgi:hypothetical protein
MVFTGRARQFCDSAQALREAGYRGRVIAGSHYTGAAKSATWNDASHVMVPSTAHKWLHNPMWILKRRRQ